MQFKKNQANIKALLDFDSKLNAINLAYTAKLELKVKLTNVRA